MKIQLDQTDQKILKLLQKNARMTVKEMSGQLNLSTTPIFERIKKMERNGVIDHYTVVINEEKLGKKLVAFSHISLREHSKQLVKEFEEKILEIPEVQECHYITGGADFIIKIVVEDMDKYREFIMEKLFEVPNIGKVESFLSLAVKKRG